MAHTEVKSGKEAGLAVMFVLGTIAVVMLASAMIKNMGKEPKTTAQNNEKK